MKVVIQANLKRCNTRNLKINNTQNIFKNYKNYLKIENKRKT